jgi:mannose-6-phosphate isomerase-like protein (cupin superfamily)
VSFSRRELALLFPAVLSAAGAADESVLPSKCYLFENLPVEKNPKTGMETREVFRGKTETGCPLAMHISVLPPGQMPHAAHHHRHEEMMLVKNGTLEATVAGKTTRVGPGSVIYINSNDEHGLKSVGTVPAQYFVLEIGTD